MIELTFAFVGVATPCVCGLGCLVNIKDYKGFFFLNSRRLNR